MKFIRLGDICSRMKAYYEALRVGKSLNRDKNASRNCLENDKAKEGRFTHKLLFNIKAHYRLPSPEKNNADIILDFMRQSCEVNRYQEADLQHPKAPESLLQFSEGLEVYIP